MSERGAALVTGAARRIGRAIALGLAREGYDIAVHFGDSEKEAEEVRDEIRALGVKAEIIRADLSVEAETARLIETAASRVGPLRCLVNNASVFEEDAALTATRESWDRHIEVNLRAPFVLIQEFARRLPEGADGNIVNIVDQRVWNLTPNFVSYTLSKDALWTLTRTMALALAPHIRVNAIGPGPTLPSPRQDQNAFARQKTATPLGRGTTPAEIADAVAFVLAAQAMTGQMIALDGGQHLGWAMPGTPDIVE